MRSAFNTHGSQPQGDRDLARHHGRYSAATGQAIYRKANLPGKSAFLGLLFSEDPFAPEVATDDYSTYRSFEAERAVFVHGPPRQNRPRLSANIGAMLAIS